MNRRHFLQTGVAASALLAMPSIVRAQAAPGISSKEILLGGVMPITGPVRLASLPYEQGIRTVFDLTNEKGGINGRKIAWTIEDDAYQPSRAVAGAKKLIERDEVFMIFGQHGTATGFSIAPYLEQVKVPMIMTTAGPNPLRKYTFGGLSSYSSLVYRLAEHMVKRPEFKKIGFLYQNDDVGATARIGLDKALKENNVPLSADVGFERGTSEFSTQVLALRDAGVDTVIVMSTGPIFASCVKTGAGIGFTPTWCTYSVASQSAVRELLGASVNGIYYASELDSPFSDAPAIVEFRDNLKKYQPEAKADWGTMLGYAHARLLVSTLTGLGDNLTRDGVVKALEAANGIEVGTMAPMGFSPENHNGAKAVRIFKYEGDKPQVKSDWLDVSNFKA